MADANNLQRNDYNTDELPPLSTAASEAKAKMLKMISDMEEAERTRRIAIEKDENNPENLKRVSDINKLIVVQEDLLRFINLKKVKEAEEIERMQRMTEDKKRDVHDELVRKAIQKEVVKEEEQERKRRIEEATAQDTEGSKERLKTYDRLIVVQEDLLRHCRIMEADLAMKEAQQVSIAEKNKVAMQEQLLHEASRRQATQMSYQEQKRQIDEMSHLSNEDIQQRVTMASKLLTIHKEMLATREPTKAIPDHHTAQVLDDYKTYMQEQLVRKSHQKDAIEAMDKEKERRIEENQNSKLSMSDEKAAVLEEISRKTNLKLVNEMAEKTKQEYIVEQNRAQAQSDTIRHINQRKADQAMDKEQEERVKDMNGKCPTKIDDKLKNEIMEHKKSN